MVMAVLAAVIHRQQTGEGQYIDLSMTDAIFSMHALVAAEWLNGGAEPAPESGLLNGGTLYDYYETKDGRWISVGSLEPVFRQRLFNKMGLSLENYGDFNNAEAQHDIKSELRKSFLTRTLDEWVESFRTIDACVEPVMTPGEALNHPQLKAREMICMVMDSEGKPVRQISSPFRFSKTPVRYTEAGKKIGADNETVLRELGWNDKRIKILMESGACGKAKSLVPEVPD